ncbi:MAG TPA: NFACT RNA binding domain-containing protein [Limnochordales bacterium]
MGDLSAAEVARVAAAIQEHLAGSWVQDVYHPAPELFVLHLYGRSGKQRLLVDLHRQRLCVALLSGQAPPNPPQPSPFCMLLRKHLEGTRLVRAEARRADRILHLHFGRPTPPPPPPAGGELRPDETRAGPAPVQVVVELTGQFANLFLLVDEAIAGWARRPPAGRGLVAGGPYRPPAPPRPAAGALCGAAPRTPQETPGEAAANGPPPAGAAPGEPPGLAWLVWLGQRWAQAFRSHQEQQLRQQVLRELRQARERLARRLAHQQEDLQRAGDPERWRAMGELLLAYAHRVRPASPQVVLPPEDERPPGEGGLAIPLEPALSAVENARRYFARYRKARRAQEVQAQAAQTTRTALQAVELALVLAQLAAGPAELQDLREECAWALELAGVARGQAASRGSGQERLQPSRSRTGQASPAAAGRAASPGGRQVALWRWRSPEGMAVLAGRSARDNDRLTFHVAGPDDLWLHARGLPGAHVVVRCGGRPVSEATLQAAASLAARLSAAGQSGAPVDVDVTRRRYVRKPPASPAGFVVYSHERTLRVAPDGWAILQPEQAPPALMTGAVSAGSDGSL